MSDLDFEIFWKQTEEEKKRQEVIDKFALSFYRCFNTADGEIVREALKRKLRATETDLESVNIDLGTVVKRDTMRQVFHWIEGMINRGEKGAS